jgi:hypothetical protein
VSRLQPTTRAVGLALLGVALIELTVLWPTDVWWPLYGPLIVLAGLFLTLRLFVATCLGYAVCLAISAQVTEGWSQTEIVSLGALIVTMVLMLLRSRSRERLGVQGSTGENMLVDLRDRLRALGRFPALPAGWHAESSIRPAYGDKFSGDFAVTSLSPDRGRLEVALVDLSGKGTRAGTRSLLFSGALGGLLGQVEPDRLLPAASRYLQRQGWSEGFASAVHVSVDLGSGEFTVGNAGHPAPFQFIAGSGRWLVHESVGGPVLGIVDGAPYPRRAGVIARGDALVLYTDGVIESRRADLAVGIDRLMGSAERLITAGFQGGARRLSNEGKAGESDDRAVVMIWRD